MSHVITQYDKTFPLFPAARSIHVVPRENAFFNIEAMALALYFVRDCAGGFLRYELDHVHLSGIWFLPDLFAIACLFKFIHRFIIVEANRLAIIVLVYTAFSLFIGYLFLDNVYGLFSSFKMILPVFVGFLFAGRNLGDYKKTLFFIEIVLYVSAAGVILNKYITYPWTGYSMESFGIERTAAKLWWTNQETRLSGFSAESTMCGFFVLMSFALTSIRRSLLWCLLAGAFSFYAILATTSKTAMSLIVLYMVCLVIVRALPERYRLLFLHRISTLSFLMIPIPFLLILFFAGYDLTHIAKFLESMHARIDDSWQRPFIYMAELMPTGFITGCGLGCFNYPQELFSNKVSYYVPVDNFYLGTYLMYGPVFLIFLAMVVMKVARTYRDVYKLTILFLMNIYTFTVLCYGPAAALLMIGLSFSDVFMRDEKQKFITKNALLPVPKAL